MPSSAKTEKLGLNNWAGADTPKRADFNQDNRILMKNLAATLKMRICTLPFPTRRCGTRRLPQAPILEPTQRNGQFSLASVQRRFF